MFFYILGIVLAVVGVIWFLNGVVIWGAIAILIGVFVANHGRVPR